MAYARWSFSPWYCFANVNGKLSLWYSVGDAIDLEYEEIKAALDAGHLYEWLRTLYKDASAEELQEAAHLCKVALEDWEEESK